jgi:hypothetical protein
MQPGERPRLPHSLLYEELKEISPWDVLIDDAAVEQVMDLVKLHPYLERFFNERLLKGLGSFPPDDRYFTEPEMSLGSPQIWVTITEHHIRIRVKAEYRKLEQRCWVVEVRAEPAA